MATIHEAPIGGCLGAMEARILDIEAGLLGMPASASLRVPPSPTRQRLGRWRLTAALALLGSAAVIGPFLLLLAA